MKRTDDSFLKEHEIVSHLTAPVLHSKIEWRKDKIKLRSMMSFSTLPISFWRYALETAGYLLTLIPSKLVHRDYRNALF